MYSTDKPLNFLNYDIHFGAVPVGSTAVKTFTIKNNYKDTVTYFVNRSKQTNPIYYVYDVNKYEGKVESGGEFHLKIKYSPNTPGCKSFDYFNIVDSHQNFYRLCFRGDCIGPSVSCSVRYLNFLQTVQQKKRRHVFELANNSPVPAIYQFDCNEEEQGIFQVESVKGTIKPKEHVFITVRFCPQDPRFYAKELCCLILHHEPIILHLFGIFSTKKFFDLRETVFRYYPFPYDETVTFKGYLSDSVMYKQVPPPISLTVNYLDFGRIKPESSCQTLTTSFTNHMDNDVGVEWESSKLFRIYPEKLQIPPKKSALYECRFSPDAPSRLSAAVLNGQVSWVSREDTEDGEDKPCMNEPIQTVPIPITMRFIGHSFPKNESWIPSVTIVPKTITLPLTLPTFPSWTTFMIESHGHLPLLFKLLPPIKTNFVMKPMIGLVRGYQIIVVQLETKSPESNSYVEQWNIELNGQVERLLPIYVKAQTDLPVVEIGIDNVIQFDPLQPGTQSCIYVPIKNTSTCRLQFEFIPIDNFVVDPIKGELGPGQEIFVICCYSSDINDTGRKQFDLIFRIQYIGSNGALLGPPYDVVVTVVIDCAYTELCAIPRSYQCGDVEWGTTIKTNFYLYNFGLSNINFMLCHDNVNTKDVILNPKFGTCGTREKIMVSVTFTIKQLGRHSLVISYKNRSNKFAEDSTRGSSKDVFWIEYHCLYATIQVPNGHDPFELASNFTLQIVDLVEHNFGCLFSKIDLWEHFMIDKINSALMETVQGEIRRINLSLPDCELNFDKLYYVVFTIKNISNIDMKISLKRRQVCDCKQVEVTTSLTFRQKTFNCPHKNLITMELPYWSMTPKSTQPLSFKIKYLLPGQNELSYIIEMSNFRTIIFNIFINSISPDVWILSAYKLDYVFNLGYVYIGLREAPVQGYWLYNNTSKPVPYKLDDLELIKLCNDDGFPVLKCLNSGGFLKPHSCAPILFRFWPIEVKTYRVVVPLMLGMKTVPFLIEGQGTDQIDKYTFKKLTSAVSNPLKNNIVGLSTDHLIIEPILTSGSTERLFFIKNLSKTDDVKYWWKPCVVDGLVKIEPLSNEGLLQPKESHSVIIKITSLNEPCSVRLLLCCEFVDYTQLSSYETRKSIKEKEQKRISDELSSDSEKVEDSDDIIELPPEYFKIALPVVVNVIGILDRDTCLAVEDQMKQKPYGGVYINVDSFAKEYCAETRVVERPIWPVVVEKTEQNKEVALEIKNEITQSALEHLASDAVFSDYFLETVRNLKNEPSPFYSQIKLPRINRDEEREKEIRDFLNQPEVLEVIDICDEVVIDGIHTTFQLGPIIKNQMDKID